MHQTPHKYTQYCVINTSGNDLQLMWASSICFSSVFTRTFNMNREMTEHRPSYRHKNDCVKIKIITYRQVLNLFKKKTTKQLKHHRIATSKNMHVFQIRRVPLDIQTQKCVYVYECKCISQHHGLMKWYYAHQNKRHL